VRNQTHYIVQMLFSSCLYPLFQNERAKSLGHRYKKDFIPRANEAHYHVKVVAFGLTLSGNGAAFSTL